MRKLKGKSISENPNATVLLIGMDGVVTRQARTNPFGYYRFEDVAVGETYILNATSKQQFTFSARLVSIKEDIRDLNFEGVLNGEN